jgi:hypothetical protein
VALGRDGSAYTWGSGRHGELGLGKAVKQQLVPAHITGSGSDSDSSIFRRRLKGGAVSLFISRGGAWGAEGEEGARRWERKLRTAGYVQVSKMAAGRAGSAWRPSAAHAGSSQVPLRSDGQDISSSATSSRERDMSGPREGAAKGAAKGPKGRSEVEPLCTAVRVADVVCGTAHTVLLSDQHHAYTCGFGGRGRLGHLETRDCHQPTRILFWRRQEDGEMALGGMEAAADLGVDSIGAGPSCTLLRTFRTGAGAAGTNQVVLFGQCCVNPCHLHESNDPLVEPLHEPMCYDVNHLVLHTALARAAGSR